MLTVKFMKYNVPEGAGSTDGSHLPSYTEAICVRECEAVHVTYKEGLQAAVQCGDAPGDTFEVTVGARDCSYNVAYVMNEAGRTVETIR